MGFVEDIQAAGGEIICDTCPVLCCTLTQRGLQDRGHQLRENGPLRAGTVESAARAAEYRRVYPGGHRREMGG